MARLIWKDSDGGDVEFSLDRRAVLGREPGVDCVLVSRGVSRRHAQIECRKEMFYLRDLGSTNGTLLNGHRVQEEACLNSGDVIQVGAQEIRFDAQRTSLLTEPLSRTLKHEKYLLSDEVTIGKLPEVLPSKVGKFHLLEKLGQGGMGSVYRATDQDSRREVAVKFIRSSLGRREAFLEFFHNREAVLAREIDHPNVIQVYEHGVEHDQHYISMEYVEGQSLYQVMKRVKLSPSLVLEILRQVACGLAAAHRQGVVHSDIKPANILLLEAFLPVRAGDPDDDLPGPEDARSDILEYEGDTSFLAKKVAAGNDSDRALLDEIRRRVGRPTKERLVDPPYFKRPSETRFLEHYLDRMQEGRGFFVLVEGEAGVGKDRLVSEFLMRQKSRAPRDTDGETTPRFLELDCTRIEGIPLLYEQLYGVSPSPNTAVREMAIDIKKKVEQITRPAVIRILGLGSASPLICSLILDWNSKMEKLPLMVIACMNPDELRENSSLKTLLDSSRTSLKELYLRPLTEYQIQRYLEDLFQDTLTGSELGLDLHRLSGGNIARVLDLLRSFFDRDLLKVDDHSGRIIYCPSLREFELEEGKNLYEKYRAYGKMEQQVLESAAFIGSRFFFDTLLRFHDVDETSLFFIVRHLLADGFFAEEGRTWYSFTNSAFQHYMAERIPPPERPHLHRKVSRLLQTVPVPESAELFQLRAHHYAGCREYGKAVQCLLEGAHLARNSYQSDLAREQYQEILQIYRLLASRKAPRKEVTDILRDWFRRDGNWYEILGELGAAKAEAWVKIADFGISFRTADEERGYQVGRRPALGTPRYLAPERGRGEYGGPRSDLFSLGIIAYEMVVGEPPFPGMRGKKVIKAYQERPVRLPPAQAKGFPPGFEKLVDGMLERDPARRWDAERVIREVVKLQFDLPRRSADEVAQA